MPGYIREVAEPLLIDCKNTSVSYNPEFVAQGEIIKGFKHPDIILIGTNDDSLGNKLKNIYNKFVLTSPVYCILKPIEAEIVKISVNGFITTKLSYANMISDLCDNIGANKHKVLKSIGYNKIIGNKYFNPGYSFGGPCFPRDTRALKQVMEQNNINGTLLESTREYNEEHVIFQANKLLESNKNEYIIENICYKENCFVPIIEESAKLKIALILVKNGKSVIIKDKKHMINEVKKEYGNIFKYDITI
jgi:nucleotide sugar dehydrogenase